MIRWCGGDFDGQYCQESSSIYWIPLNTKAICPKGGFFKRPQDNANIRSISNGTRLCMEQTCVAPMVHWLMHVIMFKNLKWQDHVRIIRPRFGHIQIETFSVSKTLILPREHPFVCGKWMLLSRTVNISNANFTSKNLKRQDDVRIIWPRFGHTRTNKSHHILLQTYR